ncbi:hypothetical protein Efla_003323 [Eimeria flavescens]
MSEALSESAADMKPKYQRFVRQRPKRSQQLQENCATRKPHWQTLELSDQRYAELLQLPSSTLSLKEFVMMKVYEMILPYKDTQKALEAEIEALRLASTGKACSACSASATRISQLQVIAAIQQANFSDLESMHTLRCSLFAQQHYQEAKAKVEKAEHLLTAVDRLKRENQLNLYRESENDASQNSKNLEQELLAERRKVEEMQRDLSATRAQLTAVESQLRESKLVAEAAVYKQAADKQEELLGIHSAHEEERMQMIFEFERRVAQKECEIREKAEQEVLQHKLQLEAAELKVSSLEMKYKQAETRYEEVAAALCKTHAAHQESLAQLSSQLHMNAAELHRMRCALEAATEGRDRSAGTAESLQKQLKLADEEMAVLRNSEKQLKLQCEALRVDLASFEHLDARVSECLQLIVSSGCCPSAELLLPLAEAKVPGYKHLQKTVALAMKLGETSKQLDETKEKLQRSTSRAQELTTLLHAERNCRGLSTAPFSALRNHLVQAESLRLESAEALQLEKEKVEVLERQNQRLADDLRNCLEARNALEDCIKEAMAVHPALDPTLTQEQQQVQLQQRQQSGWQQNQEQRIQPSSQTLVATLQAGPPPQQQQDCSSQQRHLLKQPQQQQLLIQHEQQGKTLSCQKGLFTQQGKPVSAREASELGGRTASVCAASCSSGVAAGTCCSTYCSISTAASNDLALAVPSHLHWKSCCCGMKSSQREGRNVTSSQPHRHAHACRLHRRTAALEHCCKRHSSSTQPHCCCAVAPGHVLHHHKKHTVAKAKVPQAHDSRSESAAIMSQQLP